MGSLNVATGKVHYLRNNYDHLERGNWQGQYLRSNYGHIKFGELQAQYLRNNYGRMAILNVATGRGFKMAIVASQIVPLPAATFKMAIVAFQILPVPAATFKMDIVVS